jgi:hypothetical protein
MRNKEIITQYLTGSTVVQDESPVVGVSIDVRSDVKCQKLSKIAFQCCFVTDEDFHRRMYFI